MAKKKKEISKEEKFLLEIRESLDKKIAEISRNISAFILNTNRSMKKMEESIVDAHILIKDHNKFLDQLSTSNHNLEDTVLNVLLAIRQNEYLQAWYPAQHGYDAMKIVGSHPAKTKKEV